MPAAPLRVRSRERALFVPEELAIDDDIPVLDPMGIEDRYRSFTLRTRRMVVLSAT